MLLFDGGLYWPGEKGGYNGAMPLLQLDDGTYIELINHRPVGIERHP
jgi:hypothetical protein